MVGFGGILNICFAHRVYLLIHRQPPFSKSIAADPKPRDLPSSTRPSESVIA
jgi:hypothetical protein